MSIWFISLIYSDWKWCIHLSRSLYLKFKRGFTCLSRILEFSSYQHGPWTTSDSCSTEDLYLGCEGSWISSGMVDRYASWNDKKHRLLLNIVSKIEVPKGIRNTRSWNMSYMTIFAKTGLSTLASPKWDMTRCPKKYASSVGIPHTIQMFSI